jgi:hypothetical protein
MKEYSFKNEKTVIKIGTEKIDSSNLTKEIAEDMIKRNPNNARFFNIKETKAKAEPVKAEPKKEKINKSYKLKEDVKK